MARRDPAVSVHCSCAVQGLRVLALCSRALQAISFFFESPPDASGAAGAGQPRRQPDSPVHEEEFAELLDDDVPGLRHASTRAAAPPPPRPAAHSFDIGGGAGGMGDDDDELQRALAASLAESGACACRRASPCSSGTMLVCGGPKDMLQALII